MNKAKTWTVEDYELLTIQPIVPGSILGIWAQGDRDDDCTLEAWPIDALGVAKVTTKTLVGNNREVRTETHNEVVALRLLEGYWEICEEDSNFAGMCSPGQNLHECTGKLSGRYRVRKPKAEGNGN